MNHPGSFNRATHAGAHDPAQAGTSNATPSHHDVTPLSPEKRIARLNRLYTALSRTGAAVYTHAADPYQLSHAVCRIAVVDGGLRSATLRLYDATRHSLMPYCGYGPLQGWIGEYAIPLNEPRSRAAWSARTQQPYFTGDIMTDPAVAVARDDAEQVGIRSAGALPLVIDSELVGILSVYAAEPHYFDPEIAGLLAEMARHIAFAFSKHRAESALKRTEESLRRSEDALKRSEDTLRLSEESLRASEATRRRSDSYYRTLFNSMPQAVRVLCDERVMLLNPAGQALFGVAGESAIGQSAFACVDPEHREAARARLRGVIEKREISPAQELTFVRPDGTRVPVEATLLPIEFEGRPAALSIVTDLTERKAAERRERRVNSLYAALSRTNEAIFRLTDLKLLCETVCRIAVDDGGLLSASVRLVRPGDGALEFFAGHGPLGGRIGIDTIPAGEADSNPMRVLRERRARYSNRFLEDNGTNAALQDAQRLGVHAGAVLPLADGGAPVGVLSVFSSEPDFFDQGLVGLLEEMARNLSFAFARDRSAAALAVSEGRYRALFESSPDAIAVVRDFRIVLLNPAGVRLFGVRDPAHMLGRPVADTVAPEWRERAMRRIAEVIEKRQPAPAAQYPLLRADGSLVTVEAVSLPFEFEGEPAALCFLSDQTARLAAQRRIGRLASLYQALSRTNEAIFRLSDLRELCQAVCRIAVDDGGLVSASIRAYDPATRKLAPFTGYGPLSGRLGTDVIDIDDPGSNAAMIARQGGHYVCNDIAEDPRARASKADGEKIGVNASAGFALSIDGQLAGTLSVFATEKGYFDAEMVGLLDELARNVSFAFSRQRASAELKRSEERYRMLFNAAPDAMRVVCDGRIVMFNPAGARMLGLPSPESVIGQPLESTIAPADRAAARERVRIVTTERRALPPAEQRLLHADGRAIEAEVISLPFDYEGRPAVLTIAHDLTERKAAERAILQMNAELEERVQRRTVELQQAMSDLEAFSYTVAHDLRAPLRRMSGFATLLRENLVSRPGASPSEEDQLFIDRITDGVQTMDRLIEGLLELAQLGRAQLRQGPVDLSAEARSICASLKAREPRRQVECVIAEGLTAWADARFMRDVLDNLLGNAWKFTSSHASARIEFGALPEGSAPPCMAAQAGERIYFVRDDGAGFDPSYAAKLFGTFQRLHAQHEFAGTGIGLASVKRIIAHHGGRVCAEGQVEQGACFYFSLPMQAAGPAPDS
jgi:PAS domain S-box-containing protein